MGLAAWYPELRALHIACALVSLSLFVLRGGWMIRRSPLLHRRWVRVMPHVIDTVLLASAVSLALVIRQYPFTHGWLTAKVFALIVYIVLGTVALKRGRTPGTRIAAFGAALAVFLYIAATARTRNPMPWL